MHRPLTSVLAALPRAQYPGYGYLSNTDTVKTGHCHPKRAELGVKRGEGARPKGEGGGPLKPYVLTWLSLRPRRPTHTNHASIVAQTKLDLYTRVAVWDKSLCAIDSESCTRAPGRRQLRSDRLRACLGARIAMSLPETTPRASLNLVLVLLKLLLAGMDFLERGIHLEERVVFLLARSSAGQIL
jgi:hypothetical protein